MMKWIALAIVLAAPCAALPWLAAPPQQQTASPAAGIELAQSVPCPNGRCAR